MRNEPYHRLDVLHRRLDLEIAEEQRRRSPDEVRLARLKKFKLAVKDRLAAYGRLRLAPG